MTNDFMIKLAEEYMERMGIKDTQYIIVRHHDGDNEHLHIIYNRINNEKKLISLNNDFKRNEQVCKAMKDKYSLTYGANKFRVKREKLRGSERVKHDIYHAVREEVVYCRTIEELQERLKSRGVEMVYKCRRGTSEPQGVLFTKDNITFKGSQIDRNFSYRGIQEMSKAMDVEWKKIDEQLRLAQQKKAQQQQRPRHNFRHDIPTKIGAVSLTEQQRITLDRGESVCFKDRTNSQGEKFDVYAIWSAQENKLNFYYEDPCKFDSYKEQQQQSPQSQHSYTSHYEDTSSGIGLSADGGDDPEEDAFRRRMQQQKKKRRGVRM